MRHSKPKLTRALVLYGGFVVAVVVGAAGGGVGVGGGAAVLPFGDVVDFALSGW